VAIGRLACVFAVLTVCLCAQTAAPSFTRESVLPAWEAHPRSLVPGELVSINGGNYPTELCDTQVTVNSIPAGLLAVLETQINIQIPAGVPAEGDAAIVVNVSGLSSGPVRVPFGKPKVVLTLQAPAYVHMPVWIEVEGSVHYSDTRYPYSTNVENFGGARFEVKRNGVLLKPIVWRREGGVIGGLLNGSVAPADSPHGRLPLHLRYRFDVPGKYEIRFIGTRFRPGMILTDESDWTEIQVLPYSDAQRREWIREWMAKMPTSPGLLLGDAIPSLLAFPDASALAAILPELYHPDDLVRRYVEASLTLFDPALLKKQLTPLVREKGPTPEIAGLLDQREDLFEGGHQALAATMPAFLNSASPLIQAGALQYLIWESNHPWAKTPEFEKQRSVLILNAAPAISQSQDAHVQQLLAEALGSVKSDAARDLLWKMIENGESEEQSRIALTWIGDVRDLPRLTGLLMTPDSADPDGRMNSSLAYSLHHAYGDAALPWLAQAARDSKQFLVRTSCARELVMAGQPEGFAFLLQAMEQRPASSPETLQFVRDRYPELRNAPGDVVLAFVKTRAETK
jgi:hypothetical protein